MIIDEILVKNKVQKFAVCSAGTIDDSRFIRLYCFCNSGFSGAVISKREISKRKLLDMSVCITITDIVQLYIYYL